MIYEFKKPIVGVSIFFIIGLIVSNFFKIYLEFLFGFLFLIFVLIVSCYKKKIVFEILIVLFFFFFGIVWFKIDKILPQKHILNIVGNIDSLEVEVGGVVISEPEVNSNQKSFYLKLTDLKIANFFTNKICGDILVKLTSESNIEYGQMLMLRGNLSKVKVNSYSKLKSYCEYLLNRKIYYILRLNQYSEFYIISENQGSKFKKLAIYLKNKMAKIISDNVNGISPGIIQAMVLGEKKAVPKVVYDEMIKTGTVHILVVSGFNVGIVAYLFNLILKFFRIHRILRFFFITFLLVLYCFLTGACVPVVRATIMAVFIGLSYFVKRDNDIINACALAALVILLACPRFIFDVGFLLSFSCILALGWFYPLLAKFLKVENIKIKFLRSLFELVLCSLAVWVFTFGIILSNFKMISLISIVANIFIPFIATMITICGLAMVFFSFLSPFLAYTFASVSEVLVAILLHFNSILVKIPYSYITF